MERYEGKQVLITGGTSGIGSATAKLLLENGARVVVTGRSEAPLDWVREMLGPAAIVVKSDTASLTEIDKLAELIKSECGALDALLVCAGITSFAAFEGVAETDYEHLFAVNAKGRTLPCRNWLR